MCLEVSNKLTAIVERMDKLEKGTYIHIHFYNYIIVCVIISQHIQKEK
jgi:hypothetical protein